MFNNIVEQIFILQSHAVFDERGVGVRSRYFTALQYNREKFANFKFVFLIFVD